MSPEAARPGASETTGSVMSDPVVDEVVDLVRIAVAVDDDLLRCGADPAIAIAMLVDRVVDLIRLRVDVLEDVPAVARWARLARGARGRRNGSSEHGEGSDPGDEPVHGAPSFTMAATFERGQ